MSEHDSGAKVNVSALTQRHRDIEEVGRSKISIGSKRTRDKRTSHAMACGSRTYIAVAAYQVKDTASVLATVT